MPTPRRVRRAQRRGVEPAQVERPVPRAHAVPVRCRGRRRRAPGAVARPLHVVSLGTTVATRVPTRAITANRPRSQPAVRAGRRPPGRRRRPRGRRPRPSTPCSRRSRRCHHQGGHRRADDGQPATASAPNAPNGGRRGPHRPGRRASGPGRVMVAVPAGPSGAGLGRVGPACGGSAGPAGAAYGGGVGGGTARSRSRRTGCAAGAYGAGAGVRRGRSRARRERGPAAGDQVDHERDSADEQRGPAQAPEQPQTPPPCQPMLTGPWFQRPPLLPRDRP